MIGVHDLGGLSKDPVTLLIVENLIFFIAGTSLDSTTATLLPAPIIAPPLVVAGVDPAQLGIDTTFNLMLGIRPMKIFAGVRKRSEMDDGRKYNGDGSAGWPSHPLAQGRGLPGAA